MILSLKNPFNKVVPTKVAVVAAATAATAIVGIAAVNGDYGNLFGTLTDIISNFNAVAKLDTITKVADIITNQSTPYIDPFSHIGPRDPVFLPFKM